MSPRLRKGQLRDRRRYWRQTNKVRLRHPTRTDEDCEFSKCTWKREQPRERLKIEYQSAPYCSRGKTDVAGNLATAHVGVVTERRERR